MDIWQLFFYSLISETSNEHRTMPRSFQTRCALSVSTSLLANNPSFFPLSRHSITQLDYAKI